MNEKDSELIPQQNKDGRELETSPVDAAIRELFDAYDGIITDPRESVSGEPAAKAVADYLKTLAASGIVEMSYTYKTKEGEQTDKHEFKHSDYKVWEAIADMLLSPEQHKNNILGVIAAKDALTERARRFRFTHGHKYPRERYPPELVFSMASSHLMSKTRIHLGIPHKKSPNQLNNQTIFIP